LAEAESEPVHTNSSDVTLCSFIKILMKLPVPRGVHHKTQ
jgi:hypothetical protein